MPAPADAPWTDRDVLAFHAGMRGGSPACHDLRTGEVVSYAQLHALVGRCAGLLARTLAQPKGARVATLLRNGLDAVVLLFACERVGAIYTPLNWRLTPPEVATLAADCAPALAVYETEFEAAAAAFAGIATFVVGPDRNGFREAVDAGDPAAPCPVRPGDPAVILYTSGTTGRPKGVVLSRAAMFWGAVNFAAVAVLGPQSAMLCDAPMFHTVGLVATVRGVLQQGGRLLTSDRFTPGVVLQRVCDPALGVTHIFGVPQLAQMICEDPAYGAGKLATLRGFFMGGAPLPQALCDRLLDDGVMVVNGYGMTETSTLTGMPLDREAVRRKAGSAGLGAPVGDLRIVDSEGRDVAAGEVGEIWVSGPALASGYWGQPELTNQAFGGGWFRTGDAGRRDEDGYVFVVDRWKDMYISGGENVYPAEVEAAIAALDGVREVGVVGVPNERWGEVGCAFVAIAPEAGLRDADVMAHCAGRLARYKQPASIRFVDALPRTGSGKVRKDELRRWAAS